MLKICILLFLSSFSLCSFSSESAAQPQNKMFPNIIEGKIIGNLYDSVLNKTQNEEWAKLLQEAFKDDFISTKGLKVEATFSFETVEPSENNSNDNSDDISFADPKSDTIVYARLVVGQALVEKELSLNHATNSQSLLTKIPKAQEREFISPVKSERISSQFKLTRRHPVKRRRIQPHNGVDFSAKSKTPVYPAMDGVVVAMGRARAKGKFILIEHSNGMKSTYDHLRKFQKGLHVGDYVEVSEQIGEVGRTGYATGTHLHFGLIDSDGFYVNPILYLKDYQVDSDNNEEFSEESDEASEII